MAEQPGLTTCHLHLFFREVAFALERGGVFVLLCDERNPTFAQNAADRHRGLFRFLVSSLPGEVRVRVASVTAQEVFAEIVASRRHDDWASRIRGQVRILVLAWLGADPSGALGRNDVEHMCRLL